MKINLLLLSNSRNPGLQRFEHAKTWIESHFKNVKKILFIPYAVKDSLAYTELVIEAFAKMQLEIITVPSKTPVKVLDQVDGIYIGGGNTFRLLNALYTTKLIEAVAEKLKLGMPYMGVSAGINVVCPTIKTTNDMPIIECATLKAMNLIPFQLNPHYLDTDPHSTFMGETREERIKEYHEENILPVVGLREGSALRITDESIEILGPHSIRLFCKDQLALEIKPGFYQRNYIFPL